MSRLVKIKSSLSSRIHRGGCACIFQVPFNAVALRIIHADVAPTHILYAVNASWVGLCKILDDVRGYTSGPILLAQTPICDCLGFGESERDTVCKPTETDPLLNCRWLGLTLSPSLGWSGQRA